MDKETRKIVNRALEREILDNQTLLIFRDVKNMMNLLKEVDSIVVNNILKQFEDVEKMMNEVKNYICK